MLGSEKPLLSTDDLRISAAFAAAIAPFVFLVIAMRRADLSTGFPAAMASAFAFAYVALPLGCLVQMREQGRAHSCCCTCCCWYGRATSLPISSDALSDAT